MSCPECGGLKRYMTFAGGDNLLNDWDGWFMEWKDCSRCIPAYLTDKDKWDMPPGKLELPPLLCPYKLSHLPVCGNMMTPVNPSTPYVCSRVTQPGNVRCTYPAIAECVPPPRQPIHVHGHIVRRCQKHMDEGK